MQPYQPGLWSEWSDCQDYTALQSADVARKKI